MRRGGQPPPVIRRMRKDCEKGKELYGEIVVRHRIPKGTMRCVQSDVFRIATATRVQEFDFSSFESGKEIVTCIQKAMEILEKNLWLYCRRFFN